MNPLNRALLIAAAAAHAFAQGRPDFDFLNEIARSKRIPIGKLRVADRRTVSFAHSRQRVEVAKVEDSDTWALYSVAFDQQGRVIDYNAAAQSDERAFRETQGKLSPGLQNKLAGGGNQAVPVSIWVNSAAPPVARPTGASGNLNIEMSDYLSAIESHNSGRLNAAKQELRRAGANAQSAKYAPALFADLTPAQIRQVARHPDVAAVYEQAQHTRFSDDAGTTMRFHRVWQNGNLGALTRMAVHEDDGISDSNPYLNNDLHPVIFFCAAVNSLCPLGKNIGNHATQVASTMSSTHPLYRGAAPNAQVLLSANSQSFTDSQLVSAFEWAAGNGAGVINMSWGQTCPDGNQTFWSRYADWAVKQLPITLTIASGNDHPACPGNFNVSGPGLAWNPITVGAYDDNDNGFWNGDFMAPFSRYSDPATGQQKPEVVAVGQDVQMTSVGATFATNSGTSFAAPLVAGVVMQMLGRQPTQRFWPETNKAAILTSAMRDIVAGTDQDGVGAVVATVADDTYKNNRFRNVGLVNDATLVESCGPLGGAVCRVVLDAVSLTKGQKARVAIAYDSWSTGGTGTDQLGADLDLYVVHPDNVTVVASSLSVPNAWEMVEFTAPLTGTYDIYIRKFSSVSGWPGTYVGAAWSIGTTGTTGTLPNMCAGETAVTAGATLGNIVRTVNTANGGTFFDAWSGWPSDQRGREGLIKLTLTTMRDITLSDTNPDLDLHLVKLLGAGCAADPVTYTPIAHTGNGPVTIQDLAAGTYYIVVDGANGAVGSTSVTINVAGP